MPIFRALSKPGIGNPHTPYENELLLAGVKPTAIMADEDVSLELKSAILSKKVIEVGHRDFEVNYKLFYNPQYKSNAQKAAAIYHSFWKTKHINQSDESFLNSFIEKQTRRANSIQELFFKNSIEQKLINGQLMSIEPVRYVNGINTKALDEAEHEGAIKSIDLIKRERLYVLAQPNKIDDGKELFSRYFCDSEGYPKLSEPHEFNTRVGKLLGYSESDIQYCNNASSNKAFVKLMNITTPLRLYARKTVLLNDHLTID